MEGKEKEQEFIISVDRHTNLPSLSQTWFLSVVFPSPHPPPSKPFFCPLPLIPFELVSSAFHYIFCLPSPSPLLIFLLFHLDSSPLPPRSLLSSPFSLILPPSVSPPFMLPLSVSPLSHSE